ncbi:MAG: hypothetical protein QOC89_3163, partial [Paraburkholderia sp.]|nr:hypothetical protein [Paraburkholderia sp.]
TPCVSAQALRESKKTMQKMKAITRHVVYFTRDPELGISRATLYRLLSTHGMRYSEDSTAEG